ncbi:DUF3486 family protein [Phenylobacterium sp.]|uniref:DUF3486 family protein n=1 Tax=Phenylobacterium sp. TaxID=1871053 RepID=UPI0039199EBB
MPPRGFASKLPKDLREELDRRIVDGSLTVDDVWAWLRQEGVEVGRSSVHRHIQSVEETAAQMREARETASALVGQLGPDAAEGKIGQLLIEIVQNIAFKIAREKLTNPDGPGLDMEELMFLTSSVQKLVSAQKTDQDRIAKIRAETAKSAAAAAETAMKNRGMSADTIQAIRQAVLGAADG